MTLAIGAGALLICLVLEGSGAKLSNPWREGGGRNEYDEIGRNSSAFGLYGGIIAPDSAGRSNRTDVVGFGRADEMAGVGRVA